MAALAIKGNIISPIRQVGFLTSLNDKHIYYKTIIFETRYNGRV
jgi:hypothetical protein